MNTRINRAAVNQKNIRRSRRALWLAAVLGMGLLPSSQVSAATLTFDGATGTAGIQDGTGAWNTTTTNWWNGSADVVWANTIADIAVFGGGTSGTAGAVTVGTVNANAITFNAPFAGSYTLGSGTITLGGTTPTITTAASTTATISSIIAGTGLTKAGAGTLILGGVNTFTGDINLTGGVLQTAMGNGITGNLGSVATPATLSKTLFITNGAVFRTTTSFNDNVGSATVLQIVFNIGTGGGTLDTPGGVTLTIDDGANISGNAQNASQLQGTGDLTKTGTGTLSLGNGTSNYATFTGQIFVNEGLLTTGTASTNAFGTTTKGTTVASGAAVDVKGVTVGAEPFTLSGSGISNSGALFSSTGAGGTASGPITLAANSSVGGAGTLTLSGAIGGGFSLTKVGTGLTLLSGTNTYTGNTTVSAGILNAAAKTALPGWNTAGKVSVSAGSTLGVRYGAAGGTVWSDADIATLFTTASFSSGSMLGIDTTGGAITYTPVVPTGVGINKLGTNTMTITAFNSYTGPTAVTANTLQLMGPGTIASSSGLSLNGGILDVRSDTNDTFATAGATTLDVSSTVNVNSLLGGATPVNNTLSLGTLSSTGTNGTRVLAVTGANGYALSVPTTNINNNAGSGVFALSYNPTSANVTLGAVNFTTAGAGTAFDSRLVLDGTTTGNQVTGVIGAATGGGWSFVTKQGAGTWTLSGANAYQGTTTINQGTLAFTADQALTNGLVFGSSAGSAAVGTLDLTAANATFGGSLVVQTNLASANTITIGSGKSLVVNGGMTVGYAATGGTGALPTNLTVSGAGTMSVTGTTITIGVNEAATNAAYWNSGTLDLTNLGGFSANVTNFNIGVGSTTTPIGTVSLSNTTNTIIATTLTVADTGGNNGNGTSTLQLGTGSNVIQADTINIARGKGSAPGVLKFASQAADSPGTVTITNKAGTGAANITVANINAVGTAGGAVGTLDLRGHVANVSAGTLLIANNNGTSTGGVTGTVSFDSGTFTVNTLQVAIKTAAGVAAATGTLNVSGGNFIVNNAFTLGSQATAGTAVATLNLTGGTLTSNVDIVDGGGATTSAVNLNGGTLDMTGHAIGTANTIDTLTLASGTLKNVGSINAASPITKTTAGTLTLDGNNTYSGLTTVSAGTLIVASTGVLTNADISVGSAGTFTVANGGTVSSNMTLTADGNANLNSPTVALGTLNGAGTGIVTLNSTNLVLNSGGTFAGKVQDGASAGKLTLNGGSLTLASTSSLTVKTINVLSGSTLNASALASGLPVGPGQLLTGNGNVTGTVNVTSGGNLTPGLGGTEAMTVGNVTASGGGAFHFVLGAPSAFQDSNSINSRIVATNLMTISGTGNTLDFTPLPTFGVGYYQLISFTNGSSIGNGSNFTITPIGRYVPTVTKGSDGLYLFVPAVNFGEWIGGSNNWTTLNPSTGPGWNGAFVPGIASDVANFLSNGFGTVTVNVPETVGLINLDNGGASYTIGHTADSIITLNNGTVASVINTKNGNHTINAPLTIGGTGAVSVDVANGAQLTIGGAISGAASGLTKVNLGTLVLSGTNTYGGTTRIDGGTIVLAGGNAIANTGLVNIANVPGATLDVQANETIGALTGNGEVKLTGANLTLASGTQSYAGTITGNGRLVIDGATQTLTTYSSYGGGTTLSSGSLIVDYSNALGSGDLTITGGTLQAGATSATQYVNNAVKLDGSFTFAGSNSLIFSGATILDVNPVITVNSGTTATLQGTISGNHSITKAGPGTLILSGFNDFTGGVTLTAGTLGVESSQALGASSGILTIAGGALQSNNSSTVNNPVAVNSNFAFTGTGNLILNGTTTLALSPTITVDGGATGTFGGLVQGAFGITKTGAGALFLTGTSNTYSGGTTINAGTLGIMGDGSLGPTSGALTFAGNSTLQAAGVVTLSPVRTVTINAGVTGAIDPAGYGVTVPGIISGDGTLGVTGTGSGAVTLNSANTYLGGTLLSGARLNLGNAAALNTGRLTITGGELDNTTGSPMLLANNIPMTWNGNFAFIGSNDLNLGTGGVTLAGTSKVSVNAGTLTVGGVIGGTSGLIKDGPGTLTLTTANTYTGATSINNGTLRTTANQAMAGALNFGSAAGTTTTGTLDLSNANASFGSLVAQTNSANANTITIGSGKTLTINGNVNIGYAIGTATQTATTKLTMTGGGSFVVNNAAAVVSVGVAATVQLNTSTNNTLDLTGLGNVSLGTVAAPVTTVQVAFGQNDAGTLLLSNGTNSIAATTLNVGHSNGSNGGPGFLTLGTGTNTINADTINIGFSKDNGTIQFASQAPGSPGTVTIANKAGTGGATLVVGSQNGNGTAATLTGVLDLRGHQSTVSAGTVTVGLNNNTTSTATTGGGWAAGIISFDTGTFAATTLNLGQRTNGGNGSNLTNAVNLGGGTFTVSGDTILSAHSGTSTSNPPGDVTSNLNITGGTFTTGTISAAVKTAAGTGTATGNINVSGGSLTVTGNTFTLATQSTAGSAVGNLNITGTGVVTTNASILKGGGTGATSAINLNGGTLDLTNHAIGGATPIDVLTFASGTLKNVSQINNGAGLTKTTAGTLTLVNAAYTGPTTVQAGTLALSGNNPLPNSTPITVNSGTTLDTTAVTDSLLAPAPFVVAAGQTLTNNGSVTGPQGLTINGILNGAGTSGNVAIGSTGRFAPGNGAFETASVANLTIASGGTLSFVLGTPGTPSTASTNSNINVSTGILSVGGSTNILYAPGAGFGTGTYHLVNFGTLSGSSTFTVAGFQRYTIQVAPAGNSLDLTVTAPDWGRWEGQSGGLWSTTTNWSGVYAGSSSVPSQATDVANFLGNSSGTVVLNTAQTVGQIVLDNGSAAYQIGATGGTSAITMDNGLVGTTNGILGTALIDVNNGSHTIAAGLTLANPTAVNIAHSADTLSISGLVGGTQRIIKNGSGTLTLTNTGNSFGGVTINNGVVTAGSDAVLGNTAGSLTFGGGTLRTTADLTIVRPVTVDAGGGTINTNGFNSSITGSISGTGNLTKAGVGDLTLASASPWGGSLAITDGSVILAHTNALQNATLTTSGVVFDGSVTDQAFNVGGLSGSFSLALQDNAGPPNPIALTVGNNNVSSVYTGTLSGPGSLAKIGTGTLTLSGSNTYAGGTTFSAGQLNINSATAIGTGPLAITGGTIDNTSGAPITLSTNNAQSWNGNFSFAGTNALNMGTGQVTMTGDRVVNVAASTLTVGPIDAGVHILTKNGAGTLKFTGAITNGYRLETTAAVDTGTIIFASGSSGTFSNRLALGRAIGGISTMILEAGAGTVQFSDPDFGSYIGLLGGKGTVTVNGGTLEFSGPAGNTLYLVSDGNNPADRWHNGEGSLTVNGGTVNVGTLLGMSNVRIDNLTAPSAALDGVSTLTINGGAVNIGTRTPGNALNGLYLSANTTPVYTDGKAAGTTTVNVNLNGGTLSLDRFVIGGLGNRNINLNGGTLQARSNNLDFLPYGANVYVKNGGAVVDTQAFAITIASPLIDDGTSTSGGLSKKGAGTLTLSGSNTYLGPTVVSAGVLSISNDSNVGAVPAVATPGRLVIESGATLFASSGLTLDARRGIAVGPASGSGSGKFGVATGQTMFIQGTIANNGAGTGGLNMVGPGTLELDGINTYTGPTTVTGGSLRITSDNNLGSGQLVLNGGALLVNTNLTLASSRSIAVGPAAGNIDIGSGATLTFGGAISNNGASAGGLDKIGPGTLALSGTSTYTGSTMINGGTLALTGAGSIATSSVISIGPGGTLDVSGLSAGKLVLGASQILAAPGDATATATVNGLLDAGSRPINLGSNVAGLLTFNSGIRYNGTTFGLEAVGSSADRITINGPVTALGANLIDLAVVGTTVPGTHTLVQSTSGGLTSSGATYALRYLNRTDWTGTLTTTNNSISVDIAQDQTALTAAYWKGGQVAGGLNVLALSDSKGSNWAADAGLTTISLLVPGSGADVFFPEGAVEHNTVLGAAMAFKTVTFDDSDGVSVGGNNTLTITPASSATGITANQNATINSSLALGASQTWTVATGKLLNATGSVDIGSNTLTIDGGGNTTLGGTVGMGATASGSIVKNGSGALTLGAANNYTGGTTLNSGTLNINNSAALGGNLFQPSPLIINGGTLGNTSGAPVEVTTANTQTWNGSFAFAGPSDLNLGSGNLTINNSPVVNVSQNTLTLGGYVSGSGFTKAGNGTLVVAGANQWSGNTYVTGGTLQANSSLPAVMVTVDNGATLFLNTPVNGAYWYNSVAGNGTLRVAIPGTSADTVTMSGDLSGFNGTMIIPGPGGRLQFGTSLLPSASSTIEVQDGASLYLSGVGPLLANVKLFDGVTGSLNGQLQLDNGAAVSGNVTLMANASVGSGAGVGTITGVISDGGGSFRLTKLGGGTLELKGVNTYGGGTAVNAGVLSINSDAALGTAGSPLTFTGSATLQTNTNDVVLGAARNIAIGASALTFDTPFNLTVPGVISGTGRLAKTGTAALTLAGDNSALPGTTTITAGTVIIGAASNLPAGNVILNGNGATLSVLSDTNTTLPNIVTVNNFGALADANGTTINVDRALGGNGTNGVVSIGGIVRSVAPNPGRLYVTGGNGYSLSVDSLALPGGTGHDTILVPSVNMTITGNVTNQMTGYAATNFDTLYLYGTSTGNTILGVISDSATGNSNKGGYTRVIKRDTGTWALGGANTYTGLTAIDQGTLRITADQNLTGPLTFGSANTITTTGTLDLGTASATFAGALTVQTNSTTANNIVIGAGKTLTLNENVTVGVNSPAAPNASSLTVTGAGSLIVNNPAGAFTVGTRTDTTNVATTGTVDLSGLASSTINVSTLNLGLVTNTTPTAAQTTGILKLAMNTTITATSRVWLGDSNGTGNANAVSTMTIGSGNTTISTAEVVIGGRKSSGLVNFTPGGTLTLNNGANPANLYVGRNVSGTGVTTNSTFDGTDGTFIANLDNLVIAQNTGTGAGVTNGTFILGLSPLSSVNVNSIFLSSFDSTATGTGTMILNGGTVTLSPTGGGILDGKGTSVLTLSGGTLDLSGRNIGDATNPINSLTLATGTLKNVGDINGGAALTKNTPGTLILAGTSTYPGNTVVTDGVVRLGSAAAIPNGPGKGNVVLDGGAVAGTLDLAGQSTSINGLSGTTGTVLGRVLNSVDGTTSVLTVGAGDATATFAGIIADNAGGAATGKVSLTKIGTGTQTLAGANTYTGPTTINAGSLALASTGSFANPTINAQSGGTFLIAGNNTIGGTTTPAITIAGGATPATAGTLSLVDGSINTLTINSGTAGATVLTLGGGVGSPAQLSMDVGATADEIILGSGLKVAIGAGGVHLNINGGAGALDGTTKTLFVSPGGGLSSGGGVIFDTTTGNFGGYKLQLANTDTLLQLTETPVAAIPTTAYFKGNLDANWNTYTGGNTNNSNWTSDLAGTTDTLQAPGAATDVHFNTTNATNLTTVLGRNFTIKSLTLDPTATAAVSIAAGGGTLTIAPAIATAGIASAAGAGSLTITAAVVLGTDQTWTNNSTNAILVSGGIAGAGNLTINSPGTGGVTITNTGGPVSGYTGSLTLTAGTLSLKSNGTGSGQRIAFGSGNGANLTVNGNSTLFVDRDNSTTNSGNVITLGGLTIGANNLTVTGSTTVTGLATIPPATGSYAVAFTGPSSITGNATFTMGTSNTAAAPVILSGVVNGAGQTITVAGPATPAPHAALRITNTSSATPNNFTGSAFNLNTGGILDAKVAVGGTDNGTSSLGTAAITLNGGALRLGPALGTAVAGTTGFYGRYWNSVPTGNDVSLINAAATTAATTAGLANINFANTTAGWTYTTGVNTSNMSAIWTGILNVTTPGYYGFKSQSDDGTQIYLDGTLVVNNNLNHGIDGQIPYGTTFLTAGPHVFVERYYDGTGSAAAITNYQGPDTGGTLALVGSVAGSIVTPSGALPVVAFPNAVTLAAGSTSTIDTATDTTIPSFASTGTATLNVTGSGVGFGTASNSLDSLTVTGLTTVTGNLTANATTANLVLNNVVGNGAGTSITKTGVAVLQLPGNVNLTQVVASAGTVAITPATNLNSTVVAIIGGTVDLGTASKPVTSFAFNSGSIINGTLTGTSFLKQGPGTFNLGNGTLNLSGISAVTINQGLAGTTSNPATLSTLSLDFNATAAPATGIINPAATLTLGGPANNLVAGGALSLIGKNSTTNNQIFTSTLVDGGASAITLTAAATPGSVALGLGALTRNAGGTLDITLPAGAQSATNGVTRTGGTVGTLLTDANGTVFATVAGNDWAANSTASAGNIVGASVAGTAGASLYTAFGANGTLPANANIDVTATATASAAATVNSIRFNAAGAFTLTLTGTNTISTGGVLFGSTITAASTLAGGIIQPGAGGELVFIVNKPAIANVISSVIADNGANPTKVTYRGNPTGTTGGIFSVNANNTYTGPTYITQGRVGTQTSAVTTPFGTGTNAIVYVDGNADGQFFSNQNNTIANPFVIIGNGFNEAATRRGVIRLDTNSATVTPTLSGAITMLGDASIGNNQAINTGYGVLSGNIGTSNALGATSFTLTKILTGNIRLSGTNSQTATNIAAGNLNITSDAALGTSTAPLTFTGTSTLQFENAGITIPAARGITINSGVTATFDTGRVAGAASTTIDSVITGAGAMVKGYLTAGTQTNPLILTAANTFTGNVTINHGWLTITNSSGLGTGAKTVTITNGTAGAPQLHLNPATGTSIDLPATIAFTTSQNTGAITNDAGDNIVRGNITLQSGGGGTTILSNAGSLTLAGNISAGTTGRDFRVRGDATGLISGVIANGSTADLPVYRDGGTGTWTFSGANTYTGLTTVNAGTLRIGNTSALGGVGLTVPTTDNGTSVSATGTLDLAGFNINEAIKLSGTGNGGIGSLVNTGAPVSIGGTLAGITSATSISGVGTSPTITIAGGGGTNAAAAASLGVTTASFTIDGGTTVYSAAPTVTIGGGTGATATAILSGGTTGTVTGITLTAAGSGFTAVPTIVFSGGTVTTAGVDPAGTANDSNFLLAGITITNPGNSYTVAPTVTLNSSTGTRPLAGNLAGIVLTGDASIGGTGDITINSDITETGGARSLTKVGANTLALTSANTYTGGTNINAGTLRTTHPNALGGPAATATVGTLGTLQVAAPGVNLAALNNNGATNLTAGATSIPTITGAGDLTVAAAPASLSANSIHQTKLTVNGTVNVPAAIGSGIVLGTVDGSGNTVTPGTLSLGAAGVVDLNDRPLVIHYDPAGVNPAVMIKNALAAGRNVAPGGVADGTWDGLTGIRSTTAAQAYVAAGGTEFLALGYGDTANMPFNDAPDMQGLASTVFVKYTRVGDASMDGIVGDTDVTVLGALYDPSYDPTGPGGPKHWYEGDFNYNGIVDDSDVTLLGANYDPTLPPMFASLSSQYGSAFAAAFIKGYDSTHSGATTVVPEPGALTLLGLGALGLIRRKRRQA